MIFDVAVLGGGPAGMAAATEAARGGARVVLLEESPAPGGQVYRAPPAGFEMKPDRDRQEGDALRAALVASGPRWMLETVSYKSVYHRSACGQRHGYLSTHFMV
jgi:NADPH-dependent 2,4-dienoyl-CoA reductase/sulfur reductase-like enzyme